MENSVTPRVYVLPDLDAISHRAASIFIETAKRAIAQRGRFLAAISGGSTPNRLFSLLGTEYAGMLEWQHTDFFWADERCVPKDHKDSNFRSAYEALFSKVPLPERNLHRIRGEMDPQEEAARYEDEIRTTWGGSGPPVLDLIMLGMGEDGHTASLFPGSKSVEETVRLTAAVYAERLKSWRITLTLPVINNSRDILFLVSGSSKAEVLKDILEDSDRKKLYPAGLVMPVNGCLTWLIDKDSSVNLTEKAP
ncbi:MAG: 6-phosphogluconolactonase [Nitrospirota bacterium]|nr:6-phosphogluconolactonase [Nitrospirota bacterium]